MVRDNSVLAGELVELGKSDTASKQMEFLSPWPMERPQNWIELINEPDKASELDDLRLSAQRGRPFGSEDWMIKISKQLGLEATLH